MGQRRFRRGSIRFRVAPASDAMMIARAVHCAGRSRVAHDYRQSSLLQAATLALRERVYCCTSRPVRSPAGSERAAELHFICIGPAL